MSTTVIVKPLLPHCVWKRGLRSFLSSDLPAVVSELRDHAYDVVEQVDHAVRRGVLPHQHRAAALALRRAYVAPA